FSSRRSAAEKPALPELHFRWPHPRFRFIVLCNKGRYAENSSGLLVRVASAWLCKAICRAEFGLIPTGDTDEILCHLPQSNAAHGWAVARETRHWSSRR